MCKTQDINPVYSLKKFWNIDHVIILFRIPTLNILGELEKSELVSIDVYIVQYIYKANIAD